ncbi:MAG: transposase [Mariniblastus sp.]
MAHPSRAIVVWEPRPELSNARYRTLPTHPWTWWYRKVIHTKLDPLKRVARTIRERIDNVVSYCTFGGSSNGVAEGINSKIQSIKRRGRRLSKQAKLQTAIFFYCGGLDLDP